MGGPSKRSPSPRTHNGSARRWDGRCIKSLRLGEELRRVLQARLMHTLDYDLSIKLVISRDERLRVLAGLPDLLDKIKRKLRLVKRLKHSAPRPHTGQPRARFC